MQILSIGLMSQRDLWRFWSYVAKAGPDDCWRWTGALNNGYGVFSIGPKHARLFKGAHVFAFVIGTGQEIAPGILVRHLCHNPACCNPKHLDSGTHQDNMQDNVDAGIPIGRRDVPTKEDRALMIEMQDAGRPLWYIAQETGWSQTAVWRALQKACNSSRSL